MKIPGFRYVLFGGLLVAAVGLASVGAGRALSGNDAKSGSPAARFGGGGGGKRVEFVLPRRGPIKTTVVAPGTVRAGSEVGIGAPFEGKVLELLKDEGDPVQEGDVVFRLDPTDNAEAARTAELSLAQFKAAQRESKAELVEAARREEELKVEPSEVIEARLRAKQSELSLRRSRAQLESAQTALARAKGMLAEGVGREFDVETAVSEQRVNTIGVRIAEQDLTLAKDALAVQLETWKRDRIAASKAHVIAKARHERADADVASAKLTLEQRRRDVARCEIRSTLTGVITSRGVNQGDLVVRLTGGETHYIISDLDHLLVYCDVDEGDVVRVRKGQPAKVNVNALGHESELDARVYSVGYRARQAAGEEVSTFTVRVLLRPGQEGLKSLRPSMSASVTIETAYKAKALKVPLQALRERARDELPKDLQLPAGLDEVLESARPNQLLNVVYVLVDGKAQVRVVRVGLTDDSEAEITAGLSGEAPVIVGPFATLDKLKDGASVTGEEIEDLLPPETAAPAEPSADAAPVTSE